MITLPDGSVIETDNQGNIISFNGQPADRIPGNYGGGFDGTYGTGGSAFPDVRPTPGGDGKFVFPSLIDYTGLQPAFVNFDQSLDRARQEGQRNRGIYYNELTGPDARNAALGLVDTDIEGINRGLNAFVPRIRQEGDVDTQTNINRAGRIDDYNFSRIPGFNEFNRGQVAANNQFNRDEFDRSVEGTGIDYRNRINNVLGRLDDRAQGNLPGDLSERLDRDLANRGSDLLRGSGISSVSGAGIRANDRLTIQEMINLSIGADSQIPGVAGQAQQLLQAPFERAPTLFNQPTQVPLNVANVADRIPIQSNVSAGNAQLGIATSATDRQTIDPTTILGSSLQTEQFNESSRFNRDLGVLDRQQGQLTAADNAVQGAINADTAAEVRDQAFAAYQQGLAVREQGDFLGALGSIGGFIQSVGSLAGLGSGGTGGGYDRGGGTGGGASGGGGGFGGIVEGVGDFVTSTIDGVFGTNLSGGRQPSGGPQVSSNEFEIGSDYAGGGRQGGALNIPGVITETDIPVGGGASVARLSPQESITESFSRALDPVQDINRDLQTVGNTATALQNWSSYGPTQQADAAGRIGLDGAERAGIVSTDRAGQVRTAQGSLSVLTNSGATDGQRASATAQLAGLAVNTPFTGSVANPQTIGGVNVVGATADGAGYRLADGTVVGKDTLLESSQAASTLNAFSVLTSRADNDQKIAALGSIGINAAAANEMVSQVAAGNTNAALALFNTAQNWDQMSPVQQAVAATQVGSGILSSAAATTANSAAQGSGALAYLSPGAQAGLNSAAGIAGTVAVGAGGAYTAYQGYKDHMNTIDAMESMPRSQRMKTALKLGATSGNSLGFLGVDPVSAAAGYAVLGATGSGKNTGQTMRDGWRSGLEARGLATKNENGSHEVTLADGSKYDIGRDGGHKLANKGANVDGNKDRYTFDVDWSNPVAVESIPDAHIYALATGLDPTSNSSRGTWDRVVAQGLNAATSNTDSVDGVRQNYKAMMGDIDPREVAGRIEMLRQTNQISEQEYGVYLDRTNKIFGVSIQPTDRGKAQNALVHQIRSVPEKDWDKNTRELYTLLTDQEKQRKSQERLQERLDGGR